MSDPTLAVKTIKNSILNIVSFLLGLLINFYLLRYVVAQIGVGYLGISALLLVIVAPLTLTNLGFGEATTKYVAEYYHLGDREKAASYIRTTFFMNLMIGLLGCLVIFLWGGPLVMMAYREQIPAQEAELIRNCMRVIGLGWLINQCSGTFMSVPVALQRFGLVAIGNLVFVISGAILTYLFLEQDMGLLGYTLATVGGQLAALVFWMITSKRLFPHVSLAPRIDRDAWKSSFHYGGWQTISQFGGMLAQFAEKYILGVFLTVVSVGVYQAVLTIEQKVYTVVHKLSEVLFPLFSSISGDSQERKANILIKSTWITTSLAVTLLVSVIPFARILTRLWLKNVEIADQGYIVLQTLCLGGAFGSATTAGYFFLLGIGKTQKITYISLITGLVTIGSAILVIPKYGLAAAGWSSLIAAVAQSLVLTRVMYTTLKGNANLYAILTAVYVPILVGTAVSLLVNQFVVLPIGGWYSLGFAYAGMNACTFGMILLVTRLLPHGKEHFELMTKLLKHTITKLSMRFTG